MNNLSPNRSKEVLIVDNEAQIISNYLIGRLIDEKEKTLYKRGIVEKKISLTSGDERLWRLMLRSELLFPAIDSGLALLQPTCPIRERICVMLAILETHPSFTNYFLIHKSTIKEFLHLLWSMILTPTKALIGVLIVKFY
jgi:hypothetical protein